MQIVIDIPDIMLDWITHGYPNEDDMGKLLEVVANGTPLEKLLDDIMLDIEKNMPHDFCCDEWGNTTSEWAEIMKIISKYAEEVEG